MSIYLEVRPEQRKIYKKQNKLLTKIRDMVAGIIGDAMVQEVLGYDGCQQFAQAYNLYYRCHAIIPTDSMGITEAKYESLLQLEKDIQHLSQSIASFAIGDCPENRADLRKALKKTEERFARVKFQPASDIVVPGHWAGNGFAEPVLYGISKAHLN